MRAKLLKPLSIGGKIYAGYVVLVAAACVLLAISAALTLKTRSVLDGVSAELIPAIISLETLREKGLRLSNMSDRLAFAAAAGKDGVAASDDHIALYRAALTRALGKFDKAAVDLIAQLRTTGLEATMPEIEATVSGISDHVSTLIDASSKSGTKAKILSIREQIELDSATLTDFVNRSIKSRRKTLTESQEALDRRFNLMLFVILGGVGAICIGTFVGSRMLVSRLVRPIHQLRAGMAAFAAGRDDPETIQTSGDEIGSLVDSFRDMTRQIADAKQKLSRSERLSTLGQMAGTVSHELRNPLGAIRNSLVLVQQLTAGKNLGIDRALDRIDRNIDRCDRIIGDILEFTREKQLTRERIAVDSWLADMLDEHQAPGGVPVEKDLRSGSDASIDGTRFRQVLVNLVDNAAQALTDQAWAPPEGHAARILVRAESAGPHVRISVTDNGPGIPAEKLPKIFDPLFTTKSFGVGLGLPTVRQLVEQHGGTVDVESRPGEGATFTIFLPRLRSEAPVVLATAAA